MIRGWGLLWLFVFCFSFSVQASANIEPNSNEVKTESCRHGLIGILQSRLLPRGRVFDIPKQLTFFGLKSLAYPFYAAGKLFHWLVRPGARPTTAAAVTKEVKRQILPFALYLSVLATTNLTTITYNQMDWGIYGLMPPPPNTSVVVVNGFSDIESREESVIQDGLKAYPEYRARLWRKHHRNTEYYESKGVWDLLTHLKSHALRNGKIDVLEIHGHGEPGHVRVAPLSGETVVTDGLYLAQESLRLTQHSDLKEDLERAGLRFVLSQPDETGTRYWEVRLDDIFNPNAKIILYSCSAGRGPAGKDLVQAVGVAFLTDGGTVFATRVNMYPNVVEQAYLHRGLEPNWVSRAVHHVGEIGFPALPLVGELINGTFDERFSGDDSWFLYRLEAQAVAPHQ